MTFKIGCLIIPMIAASIINYPIDDFVNRPYKADPSFTFIPDPDFSSSIFFSSIITSSQNTSDDYFYCTKYGPFSSNPFII